MCNGNRRCCLSYNLQNAKLIVNFSNNIFLIIFMYIYFLVPSSQLEIFFLNSCFFRNLKTAPLLINFQGTTFALNLKFACLGSDVIYHHV